eukprot:CAMPEP_0182437794 /NCGR_PEP_ID=MMETSP1167-20130531/85289_1 /TAXON_ID=2988 /ORGANISM="Mallomonas Sp, Strain CCMP3275" /LENGTH=538 /DNA_ID=CAMNT_0024630843 /DNA_START=211 /DNA_END=1831 /DNA_ORIENTATION=+
MSSKNLFMDVAQAFNSRLKKISRTSSYRRIWLFTNDDHPLAHDPSEQTRIIQVVKDASEMSIDISLWYFHPSSGPFNIHQFYSRLLKANMSLDDQSEIEARDQSDRLVTESDNILDIRDHVQDAGLENSFDMFCSQVRRKEFNKRILGTIPLIISPSLSISINMYKTIEPAKRPTSTWLVTRSNLPAKTSTRYLRSDTGAIVNSLEITTGIEVRNDFLPMTRAQMNALCFPAEQTEGSLRLMKFVPATLLTPDLNISPPTFIFPNETKMKGSASLFRVLLEDMISKDLIGLAVWYRSNSSASRVVAMVPQREYREKVLNEDSMTRRGEESQEKRREEGTGMNLIPLPFDGEMRRIKSSVIEVSDNMIQTAEDVISALQMDTELNYTELENPAIQRFYSVLQAVALSEEEVDWSPDLHDQLQPDPEGIAMHQDKLTAWMASTGYVSIADEGGYNKSKKRAAESQESRENKQAVRGKGMEEGGGGSNTYDMTMLRDEIQSGAIKSRTVVNLKELGKDLGLKMTGTKTELISKLASFVGLS